MKDYKMWIGGQWVAADSGETFTTINPATEEVIGRLPLGGSAEVDQAVAAAQQAFPVWSNTPVTERAQILMQIAQRVKARMPELIDIHIQDHGSPRFVAAAFAGSVPEHFQYAAEVGKTIMGMQGVRPSPAGGLNYVSREPLGVCAGIIPWNIPYMITTKIAAALATGNTIIIKPPSLVALPALKIAEILDECTDLPAGAVNIITGPGGTMGEALAAHPGVHMVAFTGSYETGKAIMTAAGKTVKPVFLELGGKNPFIVLEDADVDRAVERALSSSFFNSGMVCGSTGRYYVHASRYDEFVDKFVAQAGKRVVGDPTDKKTQMGPVVSAEHRNRVESYIRIGIEEGAKLLLGGQKPKPPLDKGYYVMPTVFTHVGQNSRLGREEIFGPVVCIMEPFTSEEDVIDLANDTPFGLTATIWTQNTAKGIRMANRIDAGNVRVNGGAASFGSELPWGGFKASGFGKEGSRWGLEAYTRLKSIGVDTTV